MRRLLPAKRCLALVDALLLLLLLLQLGSDDNVGGRRGGESRIRGAVLDRAAKYWCARGETKADAVCDEEERRRRITRESQRWGSDRDDGRKVCRLKALEASS